MHFLKKTVMDAKCSRHRAEQVEKKCYRFSKMSLILCDFSFLVAVLKGHYMNF